MATPQDVMATLNSITSQLATMQQDNARRDELVQGLAQAANRIHRNRPSILASPRVKFEEPASAHRTPRPNDDEVEEVDELEVIEGIFIPSSKASKWQNVTADEIDAEFIDKMTATRSRKIVEAISGVMKRAHLYGLPWYRMNAQLLLEGAGMRTTEREELEARIKKYQSATYNKPLKQQGGSAARKRTPNQKPTGRGRPQGNFRN